jgi:NADP-dependent 3-hydroxy acid dehydrogenase YdfG
VLPGMRARQRGHIVNISSVAGRNVFPGAAVYSASKSALDALSAGLRAELAAEMKHGGPPIRVTTIAPGAVATDLTDSIRDADTRARTEAYYHSMRHLLTPDDVADAVCFAVEAPPHVCVSDIVIRPTEMVR